MDLTISLFPEGYKSSRSVLLSASNVIQNPHDIELACHSQSHLLLASVCTNVSCGLEDLPWCSASVALDLCGKGLNTLYPLH